MNQYFTITGSRLRFRPTVADDGYYVAYWRNQADARKAFYNSDVVTPDTHAAFVANRKAHDLVWMIETDQIAGPVGMLSLTIDPKHSCAEYGRLYIDPREQGKGYAIEAEYLMLFLAFEFFHLDYLWLDAYENNAPILALHDKTGWVRAMIDAPGHTDPRGPVVHMTYSRQTWADRRGDFSARCTNVRLPAWQN